jgi:transcription antitermination factor NusG
MPHSNDQSIAPWYAVKVHARSETNATSALQHYGFQPYCPMVAERRRYCDRMKTVQVPVFPGYLFCQFDIDSKAKILNSVAVEYIVSFGAEPAAIREEQIAGLRRVIDLGGQAAPFLQRGQRVRVTHGPLTGVEGILQKEAASENSKLVLSVDLLQRSVSVSIDEANVAAV